MVSPKQYSGRREVYVQVACKLFNDICRYILVYPQGCDVCNHLSLFLCVADYDKLLPGDLQAELVAAETAMHHSCCCTQSMVQVIMASSMLPV